MGADQIRVCVRHGGRGAQEPERSPSSGSSWPPSRKIADTQLALGYAYANGQGVRKNLKEAAKWFRLAARTRKCRCTICKWDYAYGNGHGVRENLKEALKWFRLAAEQKVARAQAALGFAYASGQGIPENDREAMKWYRLAADQNIASAQAQLAWHYYSGEGVPENYIEAYAWINLAVAQESDLRAQGYDDEFLKWMTELKDELRSKMTSAQIVEAQKQSSEIHASIELLAELERYKSACKAPG